MVTPKTNSLTFSPKEVSQEMNGLHLLCFDQYYEFSRCILVSISVIFFLTIRLEGRAPCKKKKVRRRLRMKTTLRRRKRGHVWCCNSEGVRKSLHEVWDLWSIRGMPMKEREVVQASTQLILHHSNSKVGYSQASRQENGPQATRKFGLLGNEKPNRKFWKKTF